MGSTGATDFANIDPEAAESGLTVAPEGNAHQAEFTIDGKYVLAADEDFGPHALIATAGDDALIARSGDGSTPLAEGDKIQGTTVFVGRACIGDPAVPEGAAGQIAVVERGVCTFTEKVANVIEVGGYEAVLIFNREGADACNVTLTHLCGPLDGDVHRPPPTPHQVVLATADGSTATVAVHNAVRPRGVGRRDAMVGSEDRTRSWSRRYPVRSQRRSRSRTRPANPTRRFRVS